MKKFLCVSLITVGLLVLVGTPVACAQEEEEKTLLGFADYLFEKGHYYQAVTEYERFIYFNPHHPSVSHARLKIAYCYKKGEQYERAIELFRNLVDEYRGEEVGKEAAYQVGECYSARGDDEVAVIEFKNFIADYPHHPLAEKARWEMAWAYISLEDYPSARQQLLLFEAQSIYRAPSQELSDALTELPHLSHKSPLVAGLLAAVIPGAGHFYMGRKKQALFSFITNALLFYGTYEAFGRELYTAGGFLSFFSLNYYSGNIFGALNEAHKFNRGVREEYLKGYRKKYHLSLNLKGGREGAMVGVALHF